MPVVAETSKTTVVTFNMKDVIDLGSNVDTPMKHLTPQDPESGEGTAPHTSTSKNASDSGHKGSLTKMVNSYIDARDHSHFMVSFHVGTAGSQGGGGTGT